MQVRNKPTHINFCQSIDHFHAGKIERLPIAEVEKMLAAHRKIPKFIWADDFSSDQISGFDNSHYVADLINTDDLALCYFGADVGYAPIAVNTIPAGKVLVFVGEIIQDYKLQKAHPYFCELNTTEIINAEAHGNFSSMYMDVPSSEEARKFMKRLAQRNIPVPDSILVSNLHSHACSVNLNGYEIPIMKTKIALAPGTILSNLYARATRLLYKNFIGFDQQGKRFSAAQAEQLNIVVYQSLYSARFNFEEYFCFKIFNNIAKNKYARVTRNIHYHSKILHYLTLEELRKLQDATDNTAVKAIIEEKLLYHAPGESARIYREFIELFASITKKEIMHRGGVCIFVDSNRITGELHSIYPDFIDDLLAAECLVRLANHAGINAYRIKNLSALEAKVAALREAEKQNSLKPT